MIHDLTVVIGGGAAGICAAIGSARSGGRVLICEKTRFLGKKILATGNGRCNLLNDILDENRYNSAARDLVRSVFDRCGQAEILGFFHDLGLETYSQDGRIFPRTNQAASVLKVLELELMRLSIPVEYGFNCAEVVRKADELSVVSDAGKRVACRRVIIAGGGRTYPSFGADGGAFELARKLGHTIIEPVPSAVPLVVKDRLCHQLQGQRIFAAARSVIAGTSGESVSGELLFTKYGLSGTCILDISEEVSVALNRRRTEAEIEVDLVPFLDADELKRRLISRQKMNLPPEDMLAGILPNKFGPALKELLDRSDIESVVRSLKNRRFQIAGTRGWNEAEFTAGGVAVSEVDPGTLESKIAGGVYLAGEVLDVDGCRGGYNLGWAWASGLVAGRQTT